MIPEVTQQVIIHIDATPDDEYVLRILRAYRANCNCKWAGSGPSLLVDFMNDCTDKRAKLLDEAIFILEHCND